MADATPDPPNAASDSPPDAVPPEAMPDDLVNCVYVHNFPVTDGLAPSIWRRSRFEKEEVPAKADKHKFRWFHVPVNDPEGVETCLAGICNSSGGLGSEILGTLKNLWLCKSRPPASLAKSIRLPDHARFMEPSCESGIFTGGNQNQGCNGTFLFLPYLNWETYRQCKNKPKHSPTCHDRRTLAQFYYPGLQDTTSRDAKQTVSRWTGTGSFGNNGRERAVDDSLVVMVDQLWLWILNDESVLSFFPSHDALANSTASGSAQSSFIDVYTSIMDLQYLQRCEDAYDLTALIVKQSITVMFEQKNKKIADLLGIYRWAVVNKGAQRTERFQTFSHDQSDLESGALDDAEELRLSLEVADILDELNMMHFLMQQQSEVLASLSSALRIFKPKQEKNVFQPLKVMSRQQHDESDSELDIPAESGIGGLAGYLIGRAERELRRDTDELLRLKEDAENTYRMILSLLDLKSKAASLIEARSATKQGQAVMLFTIVTIIFLPLSFFTSYFGQNVSEYTGDDKNPTSTELWKIAGPISSVVIVGTLLFAYHGAKPKSRLWFWKSR